MYSETETAEFLSLLKDTREQLTYFKELGVERIERETPLSELASTEVVSELKSFSPNEFRPEATIATPPVAARNSGPKDQTALMPPNTLFGDLSAQPVRIEKSSESFEEIWADVGDCTRCPLHQERTNIVHTDGNRKARLMFVGEAPGADEDTQARPFVGRAGQLLTRIIEAIGLKREDVLIGNVNRCRPPSNRPPTPEEASMCKPFLLREIAVVQPEVIVVLGNTAMRNLLDIKQGITRVRGQFQDYHGVKVMPTFHPAYLLRDPSKKKETWEDLKKVRDYLDATRKREN
jgi:uracil-DNA glycosylase family 4